jgi:hypothetical protein
MSEAIAVERPSWMIVAGAHPSTTEDGRAKMPKRPVLLAVARRGLPRLIEATIIPAILFVVIMTTIGASVAMAAVLVWSYGAILRRRLRSEAIPAILILATMGLTIRTLVGLLSGSTFAYFVQPVATTVVLAVLFFGSVLIGRPVIARLANDFCPICPEVARRPGVVQLFTGLTILWAGVHVVSAVITFGMLVSLSVPMFVTLKTIASLGVTISAIVITIIWALRTAHNEQLAFATT